MKLLVLDGNSILNRAFYGIRILSTKDGRPTNGIYGFLTILLKLLEDLSPDGVAAAFDLRAPTFRHKMYAGYKANRKGMPPELAAQLDPLKEILTAMGVHVLACEGWEADDILGTLAKACRDDKDQCIIATGDRDSLQLVGDGVTVRLAYTKQGRPEATLYDQKAIEEEYGILPRQLIDVKALQGDNSDNIPGVAGIGPKTACSLIQQFGSLDGVYEHLDDPSMKKAVRNKLEAGRDSAYLSRELGVIRTDAPVDLEPSHYLLSKRDDGVLARLLAHQELFSLIERLSLTTSAPVPSEESPQAHSTLSFVPQPQGQEMLRCLEEAGHIGLAPVWEEGTLKSFMVRAGDTLFCLKDNFQALSSLDVPLLCEDSKDITKAFLDQDILLPEHLVDIQLAAYLLNPSGSGYDALRLAQEYDIPTPSIPDDIPDPEAAVRAAVLPPLAEKLLGQVEQNGQHELFYTIELPLARVLAEMERVGFAVDQEGIREFGLQLDGRIQEITAAIFDLVGYEFNLNSPKQLGEALFIKLGLPAKKKTKTGYSTNAEVLESLADAHPAVAMLLEYRQLAKLKSTYCDGLLKVIGADGRVRSTLNQTETRTGRISSTEPNLQNIPIRTQLGREMRRFFKAKDGWVLCDADYSQIELRVLAHMANDAAMIDAFRTGEDIHQITASQVFHMPPEMVTPLMRSRAKAVNFGIVYGIGAFSLAKDIGVSRAEASNYIKGYFATYAGVKRYMDQVVEDAKKEGYAQTLFGRRRYLPELTSSNANLRAFGERVARNMPIQGTAADIIKIAMIRVRDRLKAEGLKARMILQVHDELLVEAPLDEAERASAILREEMEAAAQMAVPLKVDVGQGETWYDAH